MNNMFHIRMTPIIAGLLLFSLAANDCPAEQWTSSTLQIPQGSKSVRVVLPELVAKNTNSILVDNLDQDDKVISRAGCRQVEMALSSPQEDIYRVVEIPRPHSRLRLTADIDTTRDVAAHWNGENLFPGGGFESDWGLPQQNPCFLYDLQTFRTGKRALKFDGALSNGKAAIAYSYATEVLKLLQQENPPGMFLRSFSRLETGVGGGCQMRLRQFQNGRYMGDLGELGIITGQAGEWRESRVRLKRPPNPDADSLDVFLVIQAPQAQSVFQIDDIQFMPIQTFRPRLIFSGIEKELTAGSQWNSQIRLNTGPIYTQKRRIGWSSDRSDKSTQSTVLIVESDPLAKASYQLSITLRLGKEKKAELHVSLQNGSADLTMPLPGKAGNYQLEYELKSPAGLISDVEYLTVVANPFADE